MLVSINDAAMLISNETKKRSEVQVGELLND
jgi:hypothetical protein